MKRHLKIKHLIQNKSVLKYFPKNKNTRLQSNGIFPFNLIQLAPLKENEKAYFHPNKM